MNAFVKTRAHPSDEGGQRMSHAAISPERALQVELHRLALELLQETSRVICHVKARDKTLDRTEPPV